MARVEARLGLPPAAAETIVRRAESIERDTAGAVAEVAAALGPGPFALVMLFVGRGHAPAAAGAAVLRLFPGETVIGCTTAGEIGVSGYLDGAVVAVGLPLSHFRASVLSIADVAGFDEAPVAEVLRMRSALANRAPAWVNEFAFMLADGLSMKEDRIVAALAPALGTTPLLGGSAGDGLSFERTFVLTGGTFRQNAAVVAFIRTACRIKVFRFDHLVPTEQRMVVTDADPARRIVRELNGEPAARAYARALERGPDQLSAFTFAAHPMTVRVGDRHHVCSIHRVEPNGDLRFFTAVDEGLVLTLAEGRDILSHLEESLAALAPGEPPDAIIACDCILRRLEVEERQAVQPASVTLSRYRVIGFNGYGEQMNMLHVNQTFTGVAIFAPADAPADAPSDAQPAAGAPEAA
jgi:hypothetical protein